MNRLLLLLLVVGSMAMSACSTFSGIGKDMKETGSFISGNSAHDAYNQSARDF